MEENNKLYIVTLRGMTYSSIGTAYGTSYVVAENPTEAYKKVKDFLDANDIGHIRQRELLSVELVAEEERFTNTGTMLFL